MTEQFLNCEEILKAAEKARCLVPEGFSGVCEREALDFAGAVVDSLRDGLLILDTQLQVLFANHSFYTTFETSAEECLGLSVFEICRNQFRSRHLKRKLESVLQENASFNDFELLLRTKSGPGRLLLLNGRQIIRKQALAPMVLLALEDVTERKAMEAELQSAYWELESRVQEIVEMRRTVSMREDVERMSRHDLKTPLLAVVGFARMLQRDPNLTERQKKLLGVIEEAGFRMQDMINMSLKLFRMEAGTFVPDAEPVDLVAETSELLRELEPQVKNRQVRIHAFVNDNLLKEGMKLLVEGSPVLFRGMMENIVRNALEASPEGGCVSIQLRESKDRIVIAVHNFGTIPNEAKKRFFQKYNTCGKKEGSGLGVYNACLIAKSFGGEMKYSTSEQAGTWVWFELPRTCSAKKESRDAGPVNSS